MQPRRLNVMIATFPYGGNGGCASEQPTVREYFCKLIPQMKADPRIDKVAVISINDTPITMSRNNAVIKARELGMDLLLMMDSDMEADCELGHDPTAKPFWDEAFNAIYEHYDKGPLVVGAPYCGPPNGTENVYVFYFDNFGVRGDETKVTLEQYPRTLAAELSGIQECGALPTGLILFDMRIFEDCEPCHRRKEDTLAMLLAGKLTLEQASRDLSEGWFYYEWKNSYAAEKASTEDVTATRDMALACVVKRGYNPLRCTWSSWAGHIKPWTVRKPRRYTVESVAGNFQRAVLEGRRADESRIDVKSFLKANIDRLERFTPQLQATDQQ